MTTFPHLHNHSHYSYEKTPISIDEIISREKELGSETFTITDTDSPTAWAKALRQSRLQEIKMLPGLELFVKPDKEYDKKHLSESLSKFKRISNLKKFPEDSVEVMKEYFGEIEVGESVEPYLTQIELKVRELSDKLNDKVRLESNQLKESEYPLSYDYFKLLLIARNSFGLSNIMSLYSLKTDDVDDPHHDKFDNFKNIKANHDKGIFYGFDIFTGFRDSKVRFLILNNQLEEAKNEILKYLENNNTHLVLEGHNLDQDRISNKVLFDIYEDIINNEETNFKLDLVAANDTYFAYKEDKDEHDLYQAIFNDLAYGEDSYENQEMMDESTMAEYLRQVDVPEEVIQLAIQNSKDFADSVSYMDFPKGKPLGDYSAELREAAERGIEWRFGKSSLIDENGQPTREWTEEDDKYIEKVREQMEYELETIESMGFTEYFIKVMQIMDTVRDLGVLRGTSRGSGGGSIVSYLTGITNTNPLTYGLYFERFLNRGRGHTPVKDKDGNIVKQWNGEVMYNYSFPDIDNDLSSAMMVPDDFEL